MSRVYQNTYSPIVNSSLVGGRLTLESGVSISSTDQTQLAIVALLLY